MYLLSTPPVVPCARTENRAPGICYITLLHTININSVRNKFISSTKFNNFYEENVYDFCIVFDYKPIFFCDF